MKRQDEYLKALRQHDWYYMYSDDHKVWQRGREAAARIEEMRRELDIEFKVWNENCPADCRVGV